jgi:phospholipid N-methyltransferase
LQQRFQRDPLFQPAADRCRVIHDRIESFGGLAEYDLVISGLPLNNFDVAVVESILDAFSRFVRPGGKVSFFEYFAIRRVRAVVSNRRQRERLRGIDRVLGNFLSAHACGRELVWRNVPPAWVHHVRIGNPAVLPAETPLRLPGD